jgi:hypothetical protein
MNRNRRQDTQIQHNFSPIVENAVVVNNSQLAGILNLSSSHPVAERKGTGSALEIILSGRTLTNSKADKKEK